MKQAILYILLIVFTASSAVVFARTMTKPAAESLEKYLPALKNKSVGVVAHPASLVGKRNLVDTLISRGVSVAAIFSPEHGFRNFEEAGQSIKNGIDQTTGIPVISLYGKKKKPDPADLEKLDLVVFDLQDVGVRFYTYISTLTYLMEACAGSNVPLIVLDRPNPNGYYIDGPVLEEECTSFVGLHPVPVVYGMTIGEYALMVNGEGWLKGGMVCDLTVIPMNGYLHSVRSELAANPSPNLQDANAIRLYPSLCLFEGTIMSVGRGTDFPFSVYGHPDYPEHAFSFVPVEKPGAAKNPPFKGNRCFGVDLRDYFSQHPDQTDRIQLSWLQDSFEKMGSDPKFFTDFFDLLAGNKTLRNQVIQGISADEIRRSWQPGLEKFREVRQKYLLYP